MCPGEPAILKILLTNDDGVYAPGLWEAVRALQQVGDLFVVAPDREQSGVGASLTLHSPLSVRKVQTDAFLGGDGSAPCGVTAYAVEGTPGDCCILGLEKLVGPVDLVVSGINSGSNLGWDVMVSGTIGGALQGFVRGYPTIAISVGSMRDPQFEVAAGLLRLIGQRLREGTPDPGLFLNINVPNVPLEKITAAQVTRLGGRSYGESVREEAVGPRKRYWIHRDRHMSGDAQPGTDMWAVKNSQISITPLQIGLGNPEQIPAIESLLAGLSAQLLSQPD